MRYFDQIMDDSTEKNDISDGVVAITDIAVYCITSAVVLALRPSFDQRLGLRTILLQICVGFVVLSVARLLLNVYRYGKTGDKVTLILRIVVSDCIAAVAYYMVQHLLNYTDRIELATVSLIIAPVMAEGVFLRWSQYYRNRRSIELSEAIPFSPPDISELEIQEVVKTLRSGWITTGPRTKLLEKNLKEYLGASGCVCLNSNTACLEMALRLLGIGEGDEVITCAYTYTASASPVIHVGAKLVLVDCNKLPGTIEMDYENLEKAITTRTKAIIPVDLCGIPCDYDRIFKIVEEKRNLFTACNEVQKAIGRIAVVADAAHALGAEYHGTMVGNIADFTSFSFHAVKNLTTGEGGALVWKHIDGIEDKQIYKQLQLFSLHGQSKDSLSKAQKGGWEYDIVGTWYKCNMTDIAAAIGLAQLERYPKMLKRRRDIIGMYDEELVKLGVDVLDHYSCERTSSGHLYLTRIPKASEDIRNSIIQQLSENGVLCNVHYKPLPMMTAYKELGFDIMDYPNAYDKYCNEITLPLYSTLSDERIKKVIESYIVVLRKNGIV